MRRPLLALAFVLLLLAPTRAEEETIPIEVASHPGVEVTAAQLAWIRTWLKEHLHPVDLAVVEVDVDNRVHPGSLVCAEARLPAKDAGTYHVQRVIRIAHESWDTYGDAYGFGGAEEIGPWRVVDTYRVERVFHLGETRKVLPLGDDLGYDEVHALLRAIHDRAVLIAPSATGTPLPKLESITWVSRQDDQYKVMMTDAEDGLSGSFCEGVMKDGRFHVLASGVWIS